MTILDKIQLLQKNYPILRKRSIVVRVLNALDKPYQITVFPSAIIAMYLIEAVKEQSIEQ